MKHLDRVEEYFIIAAVVAAETFVLLNVILRYLFSYALDWPMEIGEFLLIAVTFVGCSVAVRKHAHIRIEVVSHLFPGIKKQLELIGDVFFLIFGFLVLYLGVSYAYRLYELRMMKVSIAAGIPMYIPYLVVPISAALLNLRLVQRLTHSFSKL